MRDWENTWWGILLQVAIVVVLFASILLILFVQAQPVR